MEEISNVAVLITHSSTASSSSPTPSALGSLSQTQTQQAIVEDTSQSLQQKQAADSLIQVIEKLSKIVEKQPQRRSTLVGQKRALHRPLLLGEEEVRRGRGPAEEALSIRKLRGTVRGRRAQRK